ncbi:radical SAM protein [Butyrivibrio sp. AE2032]|uniref:radical SAM protein n=1 Tax=Butyrivibrio sp. AE2032 TaxID=1458463 RepID=UPI00054DDD7E|nr:radical SAM protein [Butyrivibrio sp. AE2032]
MKTIDQYSSCTLCPRNCRVDRRISTGYCREKSSLQVARASLHMWEEPCISGTNGSGTVFFSGCNMGCIFCQNRKISRGEVGEQITTKRLVEIFFELEDKGANNINLVTGDMFIPTIAEAIEKARQQGIKVPFLFNTSSYLNPDSVKMLEGLIDIYLPDFKYIRDEDAIKYSNAPGYVGAAKASIEEMVSQCPECKFEPEVARNIREDAIMGDETGDTAAKAPKSAYEPGQLLIRRGVIVRHLLMPGMLIQAKMIVKYLYEKYGDSIYISLMNQFTPNGELAEHPEINRKVTESEYKSLVDYAAGLGVTNGYVQEGDTAKESFIPEFDCTGV